MIIGVTGYYCSGKEEIARFLKSEKFAHFSLSDEIRKELKKKRKKVSKENQIELGNDIREKFGASELAKRVVSKIKPGKDYVITSISNKGEVEELKKLPDFILVNVISPQSNRFERMGERKKVDDPKTFEEFVKRERAEFSEISTRQQLHLVGRMADIIINNNKSFDEFHRKIDRMLADWYPKFHLESRNGD
jgi:dephospho-CoA kinase